MHGKRLKTMTVFRRLPLLRGYARTGRDLRSCVGKPVFVQPMRNAIEYRTTDYYQRRYRSRDGASGHSIVVNDDGFDDGGREILLRPTE